MNFFHCRSAATTVQGRRPSNQDAVLDMKFPDGRHVVAVADGMGGHRSGEVASVLALEALARELAGGAGLREAVIAANAEVYAESQRDPTCAGMGTTLIALLRTEAVYQIANVGDSRAYRVDSHGIRRVSRDHSFAEEAASTSLMDAEEIARSPWRNALTRSVGTQQSVEVDLFGPFEIAGRPHTVLLCSDGLYRGLSDEAAWHHLVAAPDPATGARSLVDLALRHGSDDNISVAVIQFEGIATSPQPERSLRSGGRGAGARTQTIRANSSLGSNGAARPTATRVQLSPAARPTRYVRPNAASLPFPKRSVTRRWLAVLLNDNVLFGLSTGILLLWLALQLMHG